VPNHPKDKAFASDIQLLRDYLSAAMEAKRYGTLHSPAAQKVDADARAALGRVQAGINGARISDDTPLTRKLKKRTQTKRAKAEAQLTVRLSDGSVQKMTGGNALVAQLLITSFGVRCISADDFAKGFRLGSRISDLRNKFHLPIETLPEPNSGRHGGWHATYRLTELLKVIKSVGGFKGGRRATR
jgi:hypothetical protein